MRCNELQATCVRVGDGSLAAILLFFLPRSEAVTKGSSNMACSVRGKIFLFVELKLCFEPIWLSLKVKDNILENKYQICTVFSVNII